eukprot:CAMPEP_0116019008 /NCGR_PEP_ID=MMETSP0321-20121206/8977_1 /TAXON_ID=163516 /ORGANISM="Leptocylindrus danicus var. danicus, Strain B650" /LENGTH=296 /DNA_ID=CAMNT_0003489489 /DNA_START=47 /DNA_END=937 /DNA_ORIENTATION=+
MAESDEDETNLDSLLEAEAEAAALRRAIAEGSIPGVSFADIENEDSDDDGNVPPPAATLGNRKALQAATRGLSRQQQSLQWIEKMDVVPGGIPLEVAEVHDDLKREVAFYDLALAAVLKARTKFKEVNVPFSRPDDFYAEMVKTDEHMTKVKDRLIFESKKIEAFEQRKNNKEHKLRAKEARANKLAAKSKAKKDHMEAVSDWAKNAAANRVSGRVKDDDDEYMSNAFNKKRAAANRKYGHGGKKSRFRSNDPATLNDMSAYNPRGNFAGGKKGKGGSGSNRTGKRARDAARSRRK